MCAILYKSWAEELDKNMDWKRANHVYEMGIMNHAEPLEELKRRQEQFQLSVGRRMLKGEVEKNNSPEKIIGSDPPRQVLSKLRKSSALGTRLPKGTPGILQAQPSLFGNNQRKTITIYEVCISSIVLLQKIRIVNQLLIYNKCSMKSARLQP